MPLFRRGPQTILFVHIPKTGGTSIEEAFKAAGWVEALRMQDPLGYSVANPQHMHAAIYTKLVPRAFYDYGFAVVRNPFARLASEYRMRVADAGLLLPFGDWLDFILSAYPDRPYIDDNHIRPQVEFISPKLQIFKFEESIPSIIERVFAMLDIKAAHPIPHLRRGNGQIISCDLERVRRIAQFYAADFEAFGYNPTYYRHAFAVPG
jgi:hypothetical protein